MQRFYLFFSIFLVLTEIMMYNGVFYLVIGEIFSENPIFLQKKKKNGCNLLTFLQAVESDPCSYIRGRVSHFLSVSTQMQP